MRKGLLKFALTVVLAGLILCLVSCGASTPSETDSETTLTTLTVETSHLGDYVVGGEVDFSEIVVTATYSDGTKRVMELDDTMLSDDDRQAFFTEGVHTLTVNYGGKRAVFQISVRNAGDQSVYCATFYPENGEDPFYVYGTSIKTFRAPHKEGFLFAGWYASASLSGSRALAPYPLVSDVNFYAKWVDSQSFTVRFYDGDEILYETVVAKGESVDYKDAELYPDPVEKEGKIFTGWVTNYENKSQILDDIVIYANYESIHCTVQIEYWDGESDEYWDGESKLPRTAETLNYGSRFSLVDADGNERFAMPRRQGYTSRWVIYPQGSEEYEEFPEENYVVVKSDLSIRARHVINTYSVTVYNGVEESKQSDADLKSGDILTERVYYDSATFSDFRVNYGGNFTLSTFTQVPYLREPTSIVGYNTCWCYVITTLTGEEWRNASNQVWDNETESFVTRPGETVRTNFELFDREGNYLATVRNGDLFDIKGDVTIRAKYYKKEYTVSLRRKVGTQWVTIGTPFTEKYRTDFKLYDPEKYSGRDFATAQEVESYYLLHNVALWSYDDDVVTAWKSVYHVKEDDNFDDWKIEWYTASGQAENTKVDFTENGGEYGSLEIRDNVDLYCKDIDLRRYTVVLYYGYNFAGTGAYLDGKYDYQAVYSDVAENTTVDRPQGSEASIVRRYPEYGNKTVSYEFDQWYDYPYEPDGNGEKGARANFDYRTRNVAYYAHYKCDVTYTVTVYDRTQREKYNGTTYAGKNFDVGYDTIVYRVPAGTLFTMDMLYKGRTIEGGTIHGDVYYERATFMESVLGLENGGDRAHPQGVVYDEYTATVLRYDPHGDLETALDNARAERDARQKVVDDFNMLLNALYTYNYELNGEVLDKALFMSTYMTPYDEYHAARSAVKDVENDIEIMESFSEKLTRAQGYYDEDQAAAETYTVGTTTYVSGLYKKYSDSPRDLNCAYGKDVENLDEKVKFKFSGWYLDDAYSEPYDAESRDINFSFFASQDSFTGARSQLDLYAKWADEEKGSEGLVFRAVHDEHGAIIGVVVVDYMTKSEYDSAAFAGCGYNDFEHFEYSVNFDDSDHMPTSLGTNIDLQIPVDHGSYENTEHLFVPYPVLGVMANAFRRHGVDVKSVSIPNTIRFFEEEAFRDCYMTGIFGESNGYVTPVEDRLLYQTADFGGAYLKEGNSLTEITVEGNTLVTYASRFTSTNLVDGKRVVLLPGTKKVGAYAFFAATELQYVDFGDVLVSIGEHAFENSGLTGSDESLYPNSLVLPDSLVGIGVSAFANCVRIADFVLSPSCGLSEVGRDAVTTTGWFTTKKGVVCLNGLVVGMRDARNEDFVRDGNGDLVVENGLVYYENEFGRIYYDAQTSSGGIVKVEIKAVAKGIAEYAFECRVGTAGANKTVAAALKKVIVLGTLEKGVASCAFKNCASLRDLDVSDNMSSTAKLDGTAFSGCSMIRVIVGQGEIDESWEAEINWMLEIAI